MSAIYIAATSRNAGKTTIALGLLCALEERGYRCQYFKPVGQHYYEYEGQRADSDAWLCREATGSQVEAEMMSPVVIPPGFVSEYLSNPDPEPLKSKIRSAAENLSRNADVLVVEGTGHAGVGSCLGLSNAAVAKMLGASVLMVVPGGIGRSLDEVSLSMRFFQAYKVSLVGVVANKIFKEKYEKVSRSLAAGLEQLGTRLVGAVPYEPALSFPTMDQIRRELDVPVLCGHEMLGNVVENTIVAAMTPQNALRYLCPGTLVITPGDRVDNILLAISANGGGGEGGKRKVAGIVLTGGLMPHVTIMPLLKHAGLPVLLSREDTFTVTSRVSQRVFKINPGDTEKIEAARRFVREFVEVDVLLSEIGKPAAR